MWVTEGAGAREQAPAQMKARWTWKRLLGSSLLIAVAILFWGFTVQAATLAGQAMLFAAAAGCSLGGLWPYRGVALILLGVMALGIAGTVESLTVWNGAATVLGSSGFFLVCRRSLALAWIGSSIPFWAMSGAVPWFRSLALALVFIGLGSMIALPHRLGRRAVGLAPLPHLANGPVVPVPERVYRFKSAKRLLVFALPICAGAVLLGAILWLTGSQAGGLTMTLVGTIVGVSLGLSTWIGSRMVYRVDSEGIHSLMLFREKTILWSHVLDLFLRYQFMPGLAQTWVYYCVLSVEGVIAFPHTLEDAMELRETIERATGLTWPKSDLDRS